MILYAVLEAVNTFNAESGEIIDLKENKVVEFVELEIEKIKELHEFVKSSEESELKGKDILNVGAFKILTGLYAGTIVLADSSKFGKMIRAVRVEDGELFNFEPTKRILLRLVTILHEDGEEKLHNFQYVYDQGEYKVLQEEGEENIISELLNENKVKDEDSEKMLA